MRQRLVIADDNRAITEVLKLNFDLLGYDVHVASDGEEAEAIFRRMRPDLMILDVMMPKKNGYQVCRDLKRDSELARIPIILLTAKSLREDVYWGYDCGADAYVTKPYDPHQLELLVDQLIREAVSGQRSTAWTGLPDASRMESEFRARLEAGAPCLLLQVRLAPAFSEGFALRAGSSRLKDLVHRTAWLLHETVQECAAAGAVGQTSDDRFWIVLHPSEAQTLRSRFEEKFAQAGFSGLEGDKPALEWDEVNPPSEGG
ncbi:MAG: response regulator transcription factor [Acidobacteriota bacterium]